MTSLPLRESVVSDIVNCAGYLPQMAQQQPDHPAVILPSGSVRTFAQLDRDANEIAAGLEKVGVTRGTRTTLMVKPSVEFFALTFALFKVGAVPVLVDPGMGVKNLGTCLAEAEPEVFIGIPKAHIARALLGWAKKSVRTLVTVGPRLFWGGHTLDSLRVRGADYEMAPTSAEDMAAVLFTSGSTGVPKGAIYTHGIFSAQVEYLKLIYGIEPGEVDLGTFPLFALFGPALGMTVLVPDMDASRPAKADPRKLTRAIHDFKATNMFGSPALVDNLARYAEKTGTTYPSLRRVVSAGAPVPAATLERFQRALAPGTQIFTPYGATESLPVASIGSDEILAETREATANGAGVCVGRPVPGMDVKIIRISDEPIESWSDDLVVPDGEVGEITVRGPVVTQAYINRPDSTRLAKIGDRHRMGDVGYKDGDGRLWFCGRKSHRVQTNDGRTLFTMKIEQTFNAHPAVFRSALVGVEGKPVLCVELEKGASIDRAELTSIAMGHEHTRMIDTFLFHPSFPVDVRHNAKIFREKLATWASARLRRG